MSTVALAHCLLDAKMHLMLKMYKSTLNFYSPPKPAPLVTATLVHTTSTVPAALAKSVTLTAHSLGTPSPQ